MNKPELSARTIERLKTAHDNRWTDGYEPLWALSRALLEAGWSQAAIADPIGVSRETPKNWAKKAIELDLPKVSVELAVRPVSEEKIRAEDAAARRTIRLRREKEALAANLPRLLELQPAAQALRGPSSFSPDRAAASAEYTRLIDETLRAGVRGRVLAEALGVQQITLQARRRRSGLMKKSPSEKTPSWARGPDWGKPA